MKKESKHIGKVSIGIVCVILGMLLSLQYKSVRQNAVVDDQNAGRVETLQQLLDKSRVDVDRLEAKNKELRHELQNYREKAADESGKKEDALLEELEQMRQLAGLTDVTGSGIEVVLNDSSAANTTGDEADYLIHDSDILSVINELRDAGAEAIALNGHRLLATSEIRCSGAVVTVNGRRTSAPFVIDAIGDTDTMFNALMMRNGVVDILEQWSIQVEVLPMEDVLVPAYDGTIEQHYAQTLTEENMPEGEVD